MKLQHSETKLLSKVSNRHTAYVQLHNLPSQFRLYPEGTNIFVRRLYMDEIFDFTQLDEYDVAHMWENIARAYEDAIVSDNPNFTLYDLEVVDFQLAVAVSTIWSTKKSGWDLSVHCPNYACGKAINRTITIDNFNFQDKVEKVPVPVTLDGVSFLYHPLRVRDVIDMAKVAKADSTIKEGLWEIALRLKPVDVDKFKSTREIYDFIRFMSDEDYNEIYEISQLIDIVNYPIEVTCPHCQSIVKVDKQLKDLKVYL